MEAYACYCFAEIKLKVVRGATYTWVMLVLVE